MKCILNIECYKTCSFVLAVGPQAGGAAAQVLLSKTNDNKLDEKPRFAAAVKAAIAPGKAAPAPLPAPVPAPAPAPAPVQAPPPAPLPIATQEPPPPAMPQVPKPVLTPEFLQLFQAAFGRGATTAAPVTAPPTMANPFAQMFQSAMMPRMSLGLRGGMFGGARANMPNMFGQGYYPTTASYSYFNRGPAPRMCFGECKTELCDFPEREVQGFCPGGGRKIKRCCSWF